MQVFFKILRGEMNNNKRVFHWRHSYCTAYMSYVVILRYSVQHCTKSRTKARSGLKNTAPSYFLNMEKIKTFHTQVVCPARQMRSLSGLEFL